MRSTRTIASIVLAGFALVGCSSKPAPPSTLSRDALLDPETCNQCHQDHFTDWAASMHAYASDDPIFLAMNKRGQRETNGALGNFCVQCHAPMAVHEGATTDGLNLAQLPAKLKGVTCFFCHSVDDVTGTHNAALHLSDDLVMRGNFSDPVANTAHNSTYSVLHDHNRIESASLCGTCHDITTSLGAPIERTFAEWQASVFSHPQGGDACAACHMHQDPTERPIANAPGVHSRYFHAHSFPAIDSALTPGFAQVDGGSAPLQTFLNTTLQTALCVKTTGNDSAIRVIVDNVAAGHGFPSGSGQDRRVWTEVIAYKGSQVIYQSGVVPDGTPVTSIQNDPDLWLIRDCMFDGQKNQVHMFWQAASYETNQFPTLATFDKTDPRFYQTHYIQNFPRGTGTFATPDRVTLRIRVRPVGLDVLDDLIATGDLDPSIRAAMPTLNLEDPTGNPVLTWTADTAKAQYIEGATPVFCITNTGLNVASQTTPAAGHTLCKP